MGFALHMVLHLVIPAGVARLLYRSRWRWALAWMLGGMIIDVDHLLANPIFDPNRCSMGFHPLHTWQAGVAYTLFLIHPRSRPLGIGLLLHLLLDGVYCFSSGLL